MRAGVVIAALMVATKASPSATFAMDPAGSPSKMTYALPGFPGSPRIYHTGASDFFLDFATVIKLTAEQQSALNGIKERAVANLHFSQNRIDLAEHDLWLLTASDRPDAVTVEIKVRAIERLNGDQRIAFIQSVGAAARVLTAEQRAALLDINAAGAVPLAAPQGSAGSMKSPAGMGATGPKAGMSGMGDM